MCVYEGEWGLCLLNVAIPDMRISIFVNLKFTRHISFEKKNSLKENRYVVGCARQVFGMPM
jgi:hypothetical protein